MGFNFPASPTTGDTYAPGAGLPTYRWDGEKWRTLVAVAATASALISDAAPGAPVDGMLWWESDTGNLFIRYNDGDSTQWVLVGNFPSLAGFVRHDAAQSLTDAQKLQARQNINAQPGYRIITGTDTLTAADYGKLLVLSSASNFTLTPDAVTALGNGWFVDIWNNSTGICTIDPTGADTIDGLATATIHAQERMRIYTGGTSWFVTTDHAGDWVTWTASLGGSGGGTFTGTQTLRYKKVRTLISIAGAFGITSVGTATGFLQLSLPVQAAPGGAGGGIHGLDQTIDGKTISGAIAASSSAMVMRQYDNSSPLTNGKSFQIHGTYECAK